jgi:glutathionyl-hydroquinone reductase
MKIADVEIGTVVSLYVVKCECGTKFKSRTDRYRLECPSCHRTALTRDLDGEDDEIRDSSMDVVDPT